VASSWFETVRAWAGSLIDARHGRGRVGRIVAPASAFCPRDR
jgi:hypothetical protein